MLCWMTVAVFRVNGLLLIGFRVIVAMSQWKMQVACSIWQRIFPLLCCYCVWQSACCDVPPFLRFVKRDSSGLFVPLPTRFQLNECEATDGERGGTSSEIQKHGDVEHQMLAPQASWLFHGKAVKLVQLGFWPEINGQAVVVASCNTMGGKSPFSLAQQTIRTIV